MARDLSIKKVLVIGSGPIIIGQAAEFDIEPLTVPVVKKLIMEEKPDSILPTLGGQNALNIAMALADEGFLEEHNVRTIGTNTDTIKLA